jgi:hypothetical protein
LTTSTSYSASSAELYRRLRAYTTLITSLLAGTALSSIDFLRSSPATWLVGFAILAVCLVLSRFALIRSLRGYAVLELRLDDTHIERVVRTSRKSVREITARLTGGRRLSMNAVEDFERLEKDLRGKLPANVTIVEAREPVDYDHPLFYVVFGLVVGVAFTLAVRAMATLSQGGMKWATLAIACYSALLGIFVLVARPLSQRYGPKSRTGDLILGLFALVAGLVLASRSLLS